MTTRSLFQQAFAQTGQDTDATPAGWRFGTQMSSSDPVAWVTGVWWAPASVASGTYEYRLYSGHVGGSIAEIPGANGALGAYVAGGGWQLFPIIPVDVSGLNFQVTIRDTSATDSSYAYRTGQWPKTNGPLSGPVDGGSFSGGGGAPGSPSALVFMLDADVSDTEPSSGVSMSGAAALGGIVSAGGAVRRKLLTGAGQLGGMLSAATSERRKLITGAAALGRIIGVAHADGAEAYRPGKLRTQGGASELAARGRSNGLTARLEV